jgi:hypothetical protein
MDKAPSLVAVLKFYVQHSSAETKNSAPWGIMKPILWLLAFECQSAFIYTDCNGRVQTNFGHKFHMSKPIWAETFNL